MDEKKKSEKNRQLLERYLKDPTKKVLWRDEDGPHARYEFQDWVKDLPDERRVGIVFIIAYDDGTVHMRRRIARSQKFLCVDGPLAGQRVIEDEAKGYVPFNCATGGGGVPRPKSIPAVILVHREAFVPPKKARRR